MENCKICNQELTQPTKGRNRTYCDSTCRRMAEFEVRRINRRLERLEDRLINEQEPDPLIQPDEEKITFLEDAIRRQKQQLFDLIKED